jgi:sucrose-6-phosphate hydrolase SacC (GH32 family)
MGRVVWLFVTLTLLASSAEAAGTVATRAAGGRGGVPYHAACGPGEVLVGLVLDATTPTAPLVQWLESLYPVCADVGAAGSWTANPTQHKQMSVGGWSARASDQIPAATAQNSRICAPGSAVVSFNAYVGTYVDRLQLMCRKLVDENRTTGDLVALEWFPDPVRDATMKVSQASCGDLRFDMRPGETIDRLIARVAGQIGANVRCLNPLEWRITERTLRPENDGPHVVPRAAGGPAEFGRTDCPQLRPATGVHGTAGAGGVGNVAVARVVDSVGLKCFDEHAAWRPGFHFSPERAWMNDPAGLVRVGNTYHLHYQAIPNPSPVSDLIFAAKKMTWAHAVSSNLLAWQARGTVFQVTRAPFDEAPFTGSAVTLRPGDPHCTCAGPCTAAVFTRHKLDVGPQRQVFAVRCGNGPYTPPEPGHAIATRSPDPAVGLQFRDPKVVWYQDARQPAGGYWLITVAAGDRVKLYRSCGQTGCSRDLATWELLQEILVEPVVPRFLQQPTGLVSGPFVETPDLVRLPVHGDPADVKWVLTFAKGFMPPFVPVVGQAQYSESWYQVLVETSAQGRPQFQRVGIPRRLDAGPDLYAAQTWFIDPAALFAPSLTSSPVTAPRTAVVSGLSQPEVRPIVAGWQNNWRYAHQLPTSRWKGHLSLPRELGLVREGPRDRPVNYHVVQQPIRELESWRVAARPASWQVRNVPLVGAWELAGFRATQFEVLLTLDVPTTVSEARISLRDGHQGGKAVVGLRRQRDDRPDTPDDVLLYLDRRSPYIGGSVPPAGFSELFLARTPLPVDQGTRVTLRILVDQSSVEVFAGDGRVVMSGVFFPDPTDRGLSIATTGSGARIISLDVYELRNPRP